MNKGDLAIGMGLGWVLGKIAKGDSKKSSPTKISDLPKPQFSSMEDEIENEILEDRVVEIEELLSELSRGRTEEEDFENSFNSIDKGQEEMEFSHPEYTDHIEDIYAIVKDKESDAYHSKNVDDISERDLENLLDYYDTRREELEITEEE
jgi:hypothetical protein